MSGGPSLRPSRPGPLLAVAGAGAALGLALLGLDYGALPPLPLSGATGPAVAAVAEAVLAGSVRGRLAGRPGTRPIAPWQVARTAVIARASAVVGALAAGFWVGGLLALLPRLGRLAAASGDARSCGVAAVLSLALLAAALRLEHACRSPGGRVP